MREIPSRRTGSPVASERSAVYGAVEEVVHAWCASASEPHFVSWAVSGPPCLKPRHRR